MNVGSCERRMKADTKEILRVVILPHIDIISVMCKETANVSPSNFGKHKILSQDSSSFDKGDDV